MAKREFSLEIVDDKKIWESQLAKFLEGNFLQSWNWGEFQKKLGKVVLRFFIFEGKEIVGLVQMVKEQATRGPYLSAAGGPLINWQDKELVSWLLQTLKLEAKKQKVWFVRFRPQQIETSQLEELVKKNGAKKAPMHLTADLTLQLDLKLSEEELLSQMRKNHRNLIRRAERDGITTKISTDPADMEEFCDWQEYLAKKHHFIPFSREFLKTQFEVFVSDNQVALISSYSGNKLLASAFVIFYNKEAVYHYGISTPDNDKLPGSYAVQWRAIEEARNRGCQFYNFWGVAPEGEKQHRFAGVSMFKRGFGGFEVDYLSARDLPVSSLYYLTYGFEKIRHYRRKL